jgi:uncharacterized Zn-binding protein involved in type VI secretion
MAKKAIIRLGDKTSHDGVVLEAFENFNVYGKPAAGIGHRGHCPKCKKDFVIVAGAETVSYFGKAVALEGMKTSCGAVLIASQQEATVDVETGSPAQASSSSASAAAKSTAATSQATASSTSPTAFDQHFHVISSVTGKPLVGYPYQIELPDGSTIEGKTDDEGLTEIVSAPDAAQAVLTVFDYEVEENG